MQMARHRAVRLRHMLLLQPPPPPPHPPSSVSMEMGVAGSVRFPENISDGVPGYTE